MNVLIVDDNEAAADLLQELLSLQDHSARCTYSAREALAVCANESFDVALIDITLPDLPGTEVARQLRDRTHPPLLVAVTGLSSREASGTPGLFDHHLQKPIDFDALDRILEMARGASASSS
ncbi:response regulator [Variovorax boronicumulans]|uniref:response regulator n=1 Tax=Variovorax boronicumulans TaxID=436515 RepID=UPI001C58D4DE